MQKVQLSLCKSSGDFYAGYALIKPKICIDLAVIGALPCVW